jgi:hypothetical protein
MHAANLTYFGICEHGSFAFHFENAFAFHINLPKN